jgi:hypothetical protein
MLSTNTTTNTKLDLVPLDTPPTFTENSPALCHPSACDLWSSEGVYRPSRSQGWTRKYFGTTSSSDTSRFMPVGTKGTLKGVLPIKYIGDLNCPIILGNTYQVAIQPGTSLIQERGGLHRFMGGALKNKRNYNHYGLGRCHLFGSCIEAHSLFLFYIRYFLEGMAESRVSQHHSSCRAKCMYWKSILVFVLRVTNAS